MKLGLCILQRTSCLLQQLPQLILFNKNMGCLTSWRPVFSAALQEPSMCLRLKKMTTIIMPMINGINLLILIQFSYYFILCPADLKIDPCEKIVLINFYCIFNLKIFWTFETRKFEMNNYKLYIYNLKFSILNSSKLNFQISWTSNWSGRSSSSSAERRPDSGKTRGAR